MKTRIMATQQPYQYGFEGSSNVINGYLPNDLIINGTPANISSSLEKFLDPVFDDVKSELTESSYKTVSKPLDFGSRCNRQTVSYFLICNKPIIVIFFQLLGSVDTEREKESVKKAKQAEAARLRYHRLNPDEKKALNLKRTQAQKRKRQREKEMAELESILRETNDIIDDPYITEQLREKRIRARWAEAARSRYQRMSSEERRAHNIKRRMRQLTVKNEKGEVVQDHDTIKEKIKEQNCRKALAARTRYHRMTPDEKKLYNQRRTEAFRRRRLEEEALLAMPIGRINGEALDRAQQIVVRNAKRAEAARLRYQRMTPEERKAYNQKRYTPKRTRESPNKKSQSADHSPLIKQEEDALTSLERDVIRRTQQAQQVIKNRFC